MRLLLVALSMSGLVGAPGAATAEEDLSYITDDELSAEIAEREGDMARTRARAWGKMAALSTRLRSASRDLMPTSVTVSSSSSNGRPDSGKKLDCASHGELFLPRPTSM